MCTWTLTTVCPILDIRVYLRVVKGDQREVAYVGKVFLPVHRVFLALKGNSGIFQPLFSHHLGSK